MYKIKDITSFLDSYAPPAYQESYDNAGLITGNGNSQLNGVLFSLDCTEIIVDEAIEKGYNLIVAHHPIVFKGLKKITGKNYVERTIIKAIKHDIAIYAIHTNLDSVHTGVNRKISELLQLKDPRILNPKKQLLSKLTTFVPSADTDKVLEALHQAGAGHVGNYSHCSFQVNGLGSFLPNEQATPHIGAYGKLEQVKETRIEVILPSHLEGVVVSALRTAHPYEEVAYYLQSLENKNQEVGSGMIGNLNTPMSGIDFLHYVKEQLPVKMIRHTQLPDKPIKKIALCGGSGSFLLGHAKSVGADVFITADFKYHEFFDAENKIMIVDIGHYESEVCTKDLLYEIVTEKFSNIAAQLSIVNTNPVHYF